MEATLAPIQEAAEPGPSPTLCVHFAANGAEHSIWFADPGCDLDCDASRIGRLSVVWRVLPGGLLRGHALLGRDIVCDCFMLTGSGGGDDRTALRGQGLSRDRADLLARTPERPLLATAARAADLPPHLVRRYHRVLLATATGCASPQ